jgi:hypothetical protein
MTALSGAEHCALGEGLASACDKLQQIYASVANKPLATFTDRKSQDTLKGRWWGSLGFVPRWTASRAEGSCAWFAQAASIQPQAQALEGLCEAALSVVRLCCKPAAHKRGHMGKCLPEGGKRRTSTSAQSKGAKGMARTSVPARGSQAYDRMSVEEARLAGQARRKQPQPCISIPP